MWLHELFERSDGQFRMSKQQFSDLYDAVYRMAITYKSSASLKHQEAIVRFALDLNSELTRRYSDDRSLVRLAVLHIFQFVDRFYLRRLGLPCMAAQLSQCSDL